tara:strand:- start:2704 stop:2862 length:159 start_codon:yes stop_codon:yes gene_type:complete
MIIKVKGRKFDNIDGIHVTLSVEKYHYLAECTVKKGLTFRSQNESNDLYASM